MSYHVIYIYTRYVGARHSNQLIALYHFLSQIYTDFDTISNDQAERRQVSELSSALERLQQEQLGEASAISTFPHALIWKKL